MEQALHALAFMEHPNQNAIPIQICALKRLEPAANQKLCYPNII